MGGGGGGIAGVAVRLESEGKELPSLAIDETGAFVARKLPVGRYRVRALAAGWAAAEAIAEIAKGAARPVTLELEEEAALLLRVREADGSIPSRVHLIAAAAGAVRTPCRRPATERGGCG